MRWDATTRTSRIAMKLRVVSHDGLAEDFLADVPPNDHALYPAFWGTGESRSARLPFLGKNATPGTLCAALVVMRLCFGVLGWGLSTLCARYLLDQTWGS
jgi:hypothetical protein